MTAEYYLDYQYPRTPDIFLSDNTTLVSANRQTCCGINDVAKENGGVAIYVRNAASPHYTIKQPKTTSFNGEVLIVSTSSEPFMDIKIQSYAFQ
jgi:hypothetical protein